MSPLHELQTLITRFTGAGQSATVHTPIPGVILSASCSPTEPIHHVFEPVFVLVVQGAKKVMLGGQAFRYGAGEYLVVSVDLPISSRVEYATTADPCLSAGMLLKPSAIATLLLEAAGNMSSGIESDLPGLGVGQASYEMMDAVLRLLRLLDKPGDARILAPGVERELLWWLLSGPQGGRVRQIGLTDSRLSQISHAIRWIRDNYAQTLRMEDISAMAGMSIATFHRHFRAITTLTPVQYQKQLRLQEARVRLLSHQGDVASVGFSVGYNSPSQFSREYSRFYGVPPGKDAALLRGAPVQE